MGQIKVVKILIIIYAVVSPGQSGRRQQSDRYTCTSANEKKFGSNYSALVTAILSAKYTYLWKLKL